MEKVDINKMSVDSIGKRLTGETPPFFKKLRNIMLTIAAVGGAIAVAPIALPAIIVTAAGYLVTAGTVGAALSQLTVKQ